MAIAPDRFGCTRTGILVLFYDAPRLRGDFACPLRSGPRPQSRHQHPAVFEAPHRADEADACRAPGSAADRHAGTTESASRRAFARACAKKRRTAMAVVTIRQLLDSGVHFGHQTRRWNPKVKRFILTERSRHPHHRPAAVAGVHRQGVRLRQGDGRPRRHHPLRRHEEAGAGGHRRAGDARRPALRQPALARRSAHQLPDRLQAPGPHEGARPGRLRRHDASGFTKKELLIQRRELDKLQKSLGGIRNLTQDPVARSGSSTPSASTSRSTRRRSSASP